MQPIISVQEELSGEEIAVATGAIALSQYLAGSIAISIAQTVFQNKLKPALAQYAPNVAASTILNAGATGFRATLQPDLLAGVLKAYNEALVNVFVSANVLDSQTVWLMIFPVHSDGNVWPCPLAELWFPVDEDRSW